MAKTPRPWFRKERKAWFVCINGVQHNLGRNKKEAFDAFYRLMRQPAQRKVSPHSLPAIVDAFLEWVHTNRAADTYEWYRYRLQRFVEQYPDLRIDQLRPYHAQQWLEQYPDLSRNSRRNYLRAVKRCFTWAYRQGYLDHQPLHSLDLPAQERRDILIRPEEYEQLLGSIRNDAFRDLIVVTWETGCRPQELLRVEARHVDLANERWVFPPTESKSGLPRIVYLTPEALHITRRLMLKYPEGRLFRNTRGRAWTTDAVNCTFDAIRVRMGMENMKRRGVTIAADAVEAVVATLKPTRSQFGRTVPKSSSQLRDQATRRLMRREAPRHAKRLSLYALRHSWATRALELGLDALTVAVLMGHADPSTLAKVYQHLAHNPKYLLEQARRLATTA